MASPFLDRRTYLSHADAAEYAERRGASPRPMRSKICTSLRGLCEIFLHTKSTELTEISLFFCVKIMFSYNTPNHSRDVILWRLYVRVVTPHGFVQFVCDKQISIRMVIRAIRVL